LCPEPTFQGLHFLLQFPVALFSRREFREQAVPGDSVFRTQMMVWPLSAGGLVDQGAEFFVALQEVAVHAGAGDDDPSADAAVFAAEVGDCFEDGCSLGRGVFPTCVGQSGDPLLVALNVSHR
jgi:hypothetical protein